MMSILRTLVYILIFVVLGSAGILFNDWQYWAIFVLLVALGCTFIFDDKR